MWKGFEFLLSIVYHQMIIIIITWNQSAQSCFDKIRRSPSCVKWSCVCEKKLSGMTHTYHNAGWIAYTGYKHQVNNLENRTLIESVVPTNSCQIWTPFHEEYKSPSSLYLRGILAPLKQHKVYCHKNNTQLTGNIYNLWPSPQCKTKYIHISVKAFLL